MAEVVSTNFSSILFNFDQLPEHIALTVALSSDEFQSFTETVKPVLSPNCAGRHVEIDAQMSTLTLIEATHVTKRRKRRKRERQKQTKTSTFVACRQNVASDSHPKLVVVLEEVRAISAFLNYYRQGKRRHLDY